MNDWIENELTVVRVLDATIEKVWRACRVKDALRQWWGMRHGVIMSFCEIDFCVGGALHFATQRPGREAMWFTCRYRKIVDGEQLVLEQYRSDELGVEKDSTEWPASTIHLRLKDLGGKTRLTVVHRGMASKRATVEDYRQGWSETLDRLETCLG